jgi:hypothetical protein
LAPICSEVIEICEAKSLLTRDKFQLPLWQSYAAENAGEKIAASDGKIKGYFLLQPLPKPV